MATYSSRWSVDEVFVASTASTVVAPPLERAAESAAAAAQAMDPLSGMLLASPKRAAKQSVSAYSPDLCKALKAVVKVGLGRFGAMSNLLLAGLAVRPQCRRSVCKLQLPHMQRAPVA